MFYSSTSKSSLLKPAFSSLHFICILIVSSMPSGDINRLLREDKFVVKKTKSVRRQRGRRNAERHVAKLPDADHLAVLSLPDLQVVCKPPTIFYCLAISQYYAGEVGEERP